MEYPHFKHVYICFTKYNYELYVASVHTHTHHHIIFSTINNFYQIYNNYVYHDTNLLESDPSSFIYQKI